MTRKIRGRIHGKTIELDEDAGIADGQEVDVIVRPAERKASWGEGIKRSAGAAADVPEFDEVFELIELDRKSSTFRDSEP